METTTINTTGPPNSATTSTSSDKKILGKDDFLKLLIAQLNFQDPMNPMNGQEFAAQLAQFSSVEQLANINQNLLASIDANHLLASSVNNTLSATLIGKQIKASGDTIQYDGTTDATVSFSLAQDAQTVKVKLYDEAGNLVRTIDAGAQSKGDNTVSWDGKNDAGNQLTAGKYKVKIEAQDKDGNTISSEMVISGKVTGVRYKSDGTVLVVNGIEIRLADVVEIGGGN
jgi:flagellar basal-body rod modification protein FlgD